MQTAGSSDRGAGGDADRTTELTPTSNTILGLLALGDSSGYWVTKQVRRGLGQLWPRAERQLYNDPKRLVEAGYVTATRERVGRRQWKTHLLHHPAVVGMRCGAGSTRSPARRRWSSRGWVRVLFAEQGTIEQLHAR